MGKKTGRGRNAKQQRAISRQSDVMCVCTRVCVCVLGGVNTAPASLNLGVPPIQSAIPFRALPSPSDLTYTVCVRTKLMLSFACESVPT